MGGGVGREGRGRGRDRNSSGAGPESASLTPGSTSQTSDQGPHTLLSPSDSHPGLYTSHFRPRPRILDRIPQTPDPSLQTLHPESWTSGPGLRTSDPRLNPSPHTPDPTSQTSGLSPLAPDPTLAPDLKHQTPSPDTEPSPWTQILTSDPSTQIPNPDHTPELGPQSPYPRPGNLGPSPQPWVVCLPSGGNLCCTEGQTEAAGRLLLHWVRDALCIQDSIDNTGPSSGPGPCGPCSSRSSTPCSLTSCNTCVKKGGNLQMPEK